MANFLGLAFISDSTFYRMQGLYFIPAINEWWDWQRGLLEHKFLGKEVVVWGMGSVILLGTLPRISVIF